MIGVEPAGRQIVDVSGRDKNLNVGIFSDTMNVVSMKLYMMVLSINHYPFIPLSVTLNIFQGHSSVKQVRQNFYPIQLRLCRMIGQFVK